MMSILVSKPLPIFLFPKDTVLEVESLSQNLFSCFKPADVYCQNNRMFMPFYIPINFSHSLYPSFIRQCSSTVGH